MFVDATTLRDELSEVNKTQFFIAALRWLDEGFVPKIGGRGLISPRKSASIHESWQQTPILPLAA